MMQKTSVQGVNSDLIQLKPANGIQRRNIQIFFIAGNPGTVFFYDYFLSHFHACCQERYPHASVTLNALGHANHHLKDYNDREWNQGDMERAKPNPHHHDRNHGQKHEKFGLEYQIQHHSHFINDFLLDSHHNRCNNIINNNNNSRSCSSSNGNGGAWALAPGRVELILIGHSIGCYIVLEILKRSPEIFSHTMGVCLLMPFMLWRNIPLSHRLKLTLFVRTKTVSTALTMWLLSRVLQLSPAKRRSMIEMGTKGNLAPEQIHLIAEQLVTKRLVENFLTMGNDEIIAVPRDELRVMCYLQGMVLGKDVPCTCGVECNGTAVRSAATAIGESRTRSNCGNPSPALASAGERDRGSGCKCPGRLATYFLYTDNDEWAPQDDVQWLQQELGLRYQHEGGTVQPTDAAMRHAADCATSTPASYVEFISGLTHGFSMAKNTSNKVCDALVRFLDRLLLRPDTQIDVDFCSRPPEPAVSAPIGASARSRL